MVATVDHIFFVFNMSGVFFKLILVDLVPVVRKVDTAIQWINHYPVDSMVCFTNTYLLDSNLSGYPAFEQLGPGVYLTPAVYLSPFKSKGFYLLLLRKRKF